MRRLATGLFLSGSTACSIVAPLDPVNVAASVGSGAGSGGDAGSSGDAGGLDGCGPFTVDWSRPIDGPGLDSATGLATDAFGNLFVAAALDGGRIDGRLVAGNSAVVEYSSNGEAEFVTGLNLGPAGALSSVDVDGLGNVAVAGTVSLTARIGGVGVDVSGNNDLLWASLASNGEVVTFSAYGADGEVYSSRSGADVTGNRILVSANSSELDFGGNCPLVPGDLSVAKIKPDGSCDWDLGWNAPFGPGDVSLAVEPTTGDFVIGSTANERIDFGSGVVTTPSDLGYDAFVTKFTWTGRAVWTHRIANATPTDATPYVKALAVLPNGDVAIVGTFEAGNEIELGTGVVRSTRLPVQMSDRSAFLIILAGASGELLHDRLFDGAAFASDALTVAAGPGPVIAFAGGVASTTGGSVDFGGGAVPAPAGSNADGYGAFLALYDGELNACASQRWGDGQDQRITAAAFRPDGGVAITGINPGSITFDELYESSATDGFVVALKPAPVPAPLR